jgi:hypothetical protein
MCVQVKHGTLCFRATPWSRQLANAYVLHPDNIISNVPYRIAEACARATIQLARHKAALILPLTFWESQRRHTLFHENPPIRFWACGDLPSMPPGVVSGACDRYGALVQPPARRLWLVCLAARVSRSY